MTDRPAIETIPVIYRGFFVLVRCIRWGTFCARLESVDGLTVRTIADAKDGPEALDRALNLIDVLVTGSTI